MTLASDVRIQMLGSDNTNVLSNDYVNLMIGDAKEQTKISDETVRALRHYTCYLIALNWESIGAIASREGVSYRAPDPNKYLKLYNDSIKNQLSDPSDPSAFGGKVSTTPSNEFDDDGVMVKKDDFIY